MQFQKNYTLAEAAKKLENYCAYQERCHKEVLSKLQEMRMIPEAIDQIIVHLIKENYLNEERFAQSFARGKFNIKKWGRSRIVSELKQRAISKYNITSALKEIEEDVYQNTFHEIAEKKWNAINETDIQKRKRKLADYLLYRGWESELIYQKISDLTK